MSVFQFLRVLWAYRLLVVLTTVLSVAAAIAFVQIAKPVYEAHSRVMLDVIKPDPVTGQVMPTPFLRAYTKTQIELVKDNQVAGRVVENLGWASNRSMQNQYKAREKGVDLDFNKWAAQQVVSGTSARVIEGSNILEMTYESQSAERAKNVAEALRKAYMDLSLQARQEAAKRNAEWYEAQAEKARGLLIRAEQQKASYERETGIVLQDDKIDIDSARLAALAQQSSAPVFAPTASKSSETAIQLAQLDAQLAEASKSLGPNHPQLLEKRRQRELLAAQVTQERNVAGSAASAAASAAKANAGLLEVQKAKVMAQREKVERLRLLQDETDLRRDQYNKAITRAAQLRQEAEIAVTGATSLGAAVTPQAPVFPNKPLIVGAALPLGAAMGLVMALLLELIGQRVRSADDVANALDAPVLGVVQSRQDKRKRPSLGMPKFLTRPRLQPRTVRP